MKPENHRLYWVSFTIGIVAWISIIVRLRYHQYLLGQIPMLDFDSYHSGLQYILFQNFHPFDIPVMQTLGPPSVLIPYIPFALMPLEQARGLITLINLSSIWITAFLITKTLRTRYQPLITILLAILLLVPFPTRFGIELGQPIGIIILTGFLILSKYEKVKSVAASFLILIKTNYLILIFSLIRSKTTLYVIGLSLLIICAAFPFIKPQYYLDFINTRAEETTFVPAVIKDLDYYNQSLKSTLARFEISQFYQLTLLLLTTTAGIYLLISQNIPSALLFSIILSPVVWQHYIAITYPLLIILMYKYRHHWKSLSYLLFTTILLMLHLPQIHHMSFSMQNSFLASHYFVGLILLLIFSIWQHKQKII